MKTFDEQDRQIISKIISGKGFERNLINLIDSQKNLQNIRVEVNKPKKRARFLFECQSSLPSEDEIKLGTQKIDELSELIISYMMLFKYLEQEELAIFFKSASAKDKVAFGLGAENKPSFEMSINDQNIVNLLAEYIDKEIIPSPSLRALENNKFKSYDELKFSRQQVATWVAISVSLIIGFTGFYINYKSSAVQASQFSIQIEENQKVVDRIIDKINDLEESNIDYRPSITEMSKRLDEVNAKIDLAPKEQIIVIKGLNQNEKQVGK